VITQGQADHLARPAPTATPSGATREGPCALCSPIAPGVRGAVLVVDEWEAASCLSRGSPRIIRAKTFVVSKTIAGGIGPLYLSAEYRCRCGLTTVQRGVDALWFINWAGIP